VETGTVREYMRL